jgi:hypothetical protein
VVLTLWLPPRYVSGLSFEIEVWAVFCLGPFLLSAVGRAHLSRSETVKSMCQRGVKEGEVGCGGLTHTVL